MSDQKPQRDRFIETVRALGADEDEAAFKAKLATIARQKPKADAIKLSANQKRGLKQLANALFEFEPLAKRGDLGQEVTNQLVELGLAEGGPCSPAYADKGFDVGYRLTHAGWQAVG